LYSRGPMAARPLHISDPQRIRALSHPLRLELIDLLGEGPATATQCAALTGESVASCSFHLRMLAKYGYVEAAPRNGREKPWQLTSSSQEIRPDVNDPDSLRAVEAMANVYVDREVEHIHRWLARATADGPELIQASSVTGSSIWATVEEMEELSQTVQALADRFEERRSDPTQRPAGARPVRIFTAVHIDVAKEERNARTRE
jgi:DNA-binding transcriptional ArsR family regulator